METNQKIICIIQARMGSSRLPGKVLKHIHGYPMLYWVVSRVNKSSMIDKVVVATTDSASDDPIASWCGANDADCFRGSVFDVLDRFYRCASRYSPGAVVRVTGDCPLIDPGIIDQLIEEFSHRKVDFAANRLPPPYSRTYPIGLDVEIVAFSALERAWKEAKETYQREHVMPYLYTVEGHFKTFILNHNQDFGSERWTVDTPEDLHFIRSLFDHIDDLNNFNWLDVLDVLAAHPELREINSGIKHKSLKEVDGRMDEGNVA